MGDNCPIPVVKTKKAMQALTGPETIEVLVDNEIAVQNVTKMASGAGGQVSSEKLGDARFKITIQMEGALAGEGAADAACAPDARDNTVVVVSSDRMGIGNDELGKVLIKGFIFAVTQLDTLDYYGLKDKLSVGTVTNMYSIVETMEKAGKIIRP